jgi:hypothetical protein
MDLFQRADVGKVEALPPSRPRRLLLALDGSTQEFASASLAQQLQQRLNCEVGYLSADIPLDQTVDASVAGILTRMGGTHLTVPAGANYDQILAAQAQFQADLMVVPCPFGRDFHSLGEDSTGTVIDVLSARSTVPVIAIRRPDATGRDPSSHVRIVLTGENAAAETAARWAVGMVHPEGKLELLLLVEQSFYDNFRHALHAIQPEAQVTYQDIENALARTYGRLHAALQRTAGAMGFEYELLVRHEGDEQPITPEDPQTHPALMVLAVQRKSHDSQSEVHDFIRRSPHPVMVVPG